jgi:uncharacterized membrane protein YwaF
MDTSLLLHGFLLVLGAAMILGLYFLLKGRSQKVQTLVLGILSLSGNAAVIYNLLMWDAPLSYLPLHLCSINAILLPIVVLTRNKTLGNLLLVWCLGALAAIVLNFEMVNVEVFSDVFFFYYFPHVFEFGVPILLFRLNLVEKDYKCIPSTLGITMVIYTFVHLMNKLINAYTDTYVNYMFSVEATNPLVAFFHSLIPVEYWYMYLVLPIVAVYLLAVYSPQILAKYRSGKQAVQ